MRLDFATDAHPSPSGEAARRRSSRLCFLLPMLVFVVAATFLIVSGYDQSIPAYDQKNFHLPTIERFSQDWPHFTFTNYSSATTPGYHILLAAVHHWISSDVRALKLVRTPSRTWAISGPLLLTVMQLVITVWRIGVSPF